MPTVNEGVEGYVLHVRDYSDSKKLVSVITYDAGRFTGVFRVSKRRPSPRPFIKYVFNFSGTSELKTLRSAESVSAITVSQGRPLFCGMYINELLIRLLPEFQPHRRIYRSYHETLNKLSNAHDNKVQEVLLRRFEFLLLDELGVGVGFSQCCAGGGIESNSEVVYRFITGEGFRSLGVIGGQSDIPADYFSADVICAIRDQHWNTHSLKAAKRLSRMAMAPLLGGRPIKARELFT